MDDKAEKTQKSIAEEKKNSDDIQNEFNPELDETENDEQIEEADDSNVEKVRFISFKLDDEWYANPISEVNEIISYCKITPIPSTPKFIMGVINMRGNIVAVIDLRELFGLTVEEVTEDTKIIVVEIEKKTIGILVDNLGEVINVKEDSIQEDIHNISGKKVEYVKGICHHNDRIIIIIDCVKILASDEFQSDLWSF